MKKRLILMATLLVSVTAVQAQTETPTPTPTPSLTPVGWPTNTPTPVVYDTDGCIVGQPCGQPVEPGCGYGLPCGPIPWLLPGFPKLASPTPFPMVHYAFTTTPWAGTAQPTLLVPSPNPYTATPEMNFDNISEQISTLQAITKVTPMSVVPLNGTPVSADDTGDLVVGAVDLFGYIRALGDYHLGVFGPLIQFGLWTLTFILVVKVGLFFIPMIVVIFNFIVKVVQVVLDFLPL